MATNFSQTAAYIWSLADLLRGDFKQSQYGRVILPFTILRRLECVLEARKPKVLEQGKKLKAMKRLEEGARAKFLLKAAGQSFYNTSPMDLSKLGSADIKSNLITYVDSFSSDAREIFEHFKFAEFVGQLEEANLLFKVVQKVATTDLSPEAISNHDMGLVFEELIRRFAESSNETAGEHFTPRDIVRLTTSLVFMEDDDALTEEGIIRTIYDPTAGTGGFLSSGMEYVHELNPKAVMRAFGQELNPESYAICKGDMLIKGQDVSRIKLGNTLSEDQLYTDKFDYMLSNPPFGVDWKKVEGEIKNEHKLKGFDGRFGPGLPRVSDGSLLFPDAPAQQDARLRRQRQRQERRAHRHHPQRLAAIHGRCRQRRERDPPPHPGERPCWRPSSPCRPTCSTTPASRPTSGSYRTKRSPSARARCS